MTRSPKSVRPLHPPRRGCSLIFRRYPIIAHHYSIQAFHFPGCWALSSCSRPTNLSTVGKQHSALSWLFYLQSIARLRHCAHSFTMDRPVSTPFQLMPSEGATLNQDCGQCRNVVQRGLHDRLCIETLLAEAEKVVAESASDCLLGSCTSNTHLMVRPTRPDFSTGIGN